jgi:hypothetical protein
MKSHQAIAGLVQAIVGLISYKSRCFFVPVRFAPMWCRKAERAGGITNQFLMHIRSVFSSLASQFL